MSAELAVAQADRRARLSVQPRRENVEVDRAMSSIPPTSSRRYGVDQIRYFFLREVPFGQDGNYSHEAIVQRINADLANDLGNLAQRSLSMIAKNCAGVVPDWREAARDGGRSRTAGDRRTRWSQRRPRAHESFRAPSVSRRRVRGRRQGEPLFRQ